MSKKKLPKKQIKTKKRITSKYKRVAEHIHTQTINELIEKIVNAAETDEKVKWSWGLMTECRVLEDSPVISKHIEKCKSCQDFIYSRKSLAELIIKGGRL